MSEKCETCDGTGSVPAEVETAEGPMPCPYIGAPCPDCQPDRVIMEGKHQWGGPQRNREVCVNCGATRMLEGGDDG